MAAPPRHPPNMDQFEAYFQRADLDRDGRVSGAEAVAFFQGSGLPKNVLAQIWTYSDPKNSGFLGREEFYNALKLVTVAQTGRQLTRDIVMAALGGPAASKIPAPQIKVTATPVPLSTGRVRPQVNAMIPSAQVGGMQPFLSQTPGFPGGAGQMLPYMGGNQQQNRPETMGPLYSSLPMQTPGPASVHSVPIQSVSQRPPQGGNLVSARPASVSQNLSTDWFGSQIGGNSSEGSTIQIAGRGVNSITNQDGFGPVYSGPTASSAVVRPATVAQTTSLPPKPPGPAVPSLQPTDKDSKDLVISGNGFSSDPMFGGDAFSASQSKQDVTSSFTSSKSSTTPIVSPVTAGLQTPVNLVQAALPPGSSAASFSFPTHPTQSQSKPNQLGVIPAASPSYPPAATGAPGTNAVQLQWPKMTRSNIQKYMKVFMEVDKDRDGKITGEQARNLFLSWKLPREVLKQVWELSDQDGDSMLSLREFCVALYLMERYREGCPPPPTLPNSVIFDDVLLQATGPPPSSYGGLVWQPTPGIQQQGSPGIRPATPPGVLKPQLPDQVPNQVETQVQPLQKKSTVPVLEKYLVDQLSNEEQSALDSKMKDATDADKKVQDLEKEIMEAKEKIEFYRAKMQELVLYKSRCDTRLIEVIEKTSGNKREYDVLAKKYDEKCKQLGDVASKLTIEESNFREIHERKMKLYNAIVKLDTRSADGSFKVQAEQVQSDLEELVKSLNDRCKQYGLRAKPTTLVELPFGWQPGVQEGAADWDEDWDKFEEEGFQLVKEFTVDVQNIIAAPKSRTLSISKEPNIKDEPLPVNSSEDTKVEKDTFSNDQETKSEAAGQNERSLERSLPGSPLGKESTAPSSPVEKGTPRSPLGQVIGDLPSPKFDSMSFRMDDLSLHAKNLHSEQDGLDSNIYDQKDAGEISWGPTFDTHEDAEPMWNFGSNDKFQLPGLESNADDSLFGTGDFGLNPIKTGSSTLYDFGKDSSFFSDSIPATPPANDFGKKENTLFAESVPATPFYNSVFSPRFNDGPGMGSPSMANDFGKRKSSFFADSVPGTPLFNSVFSPRFGDGTDKSFDSFGSFDSNAQGNHSRFDSFNAQGNLSRFDSFNVQPGLSRFDSMRSTASSDVGGFFTQNESFTRFDSMSVTRDADDRHSSFTSLDDSDPFGSGPFKPLDRSTPKHSSDQWSAF